MFGRSKVAALVAEFLGTGVLTLVVLAVQRSTIGIPYFVALASGLAFAALTLVFVVTSGAYFNPALTIGSWVARQITAAQALSYIIVQLLGGWMAYGVYTYFVNTGLQPIGGHTTMRIFMAEAVGAFIFAMVWAAVRAQRLAASVAGAGLSLGVLVAAIASVGILNPAVALGARAWVVSDFTHWVGWVTYALGPVIGAVVGFLVYTLVFGDGAINFRRPSFATASAPAVAPPVVATKTRATKKVTKTTSSTKRK